MATLQNKLFVTEFQAIDPKSGELKLWQGPLITAPNWSAAQEVCERKLGHLVVTGEFVSQIPAYSELIKLSTWN